MRRRRRAHDDTETALANFALTFAKALLVFCVVMFLMLNPNQKEQDGVKPKIEYLITMSWPDDMNYDVDIWIQDPDGKVLYYNNKEVDFLNLERDDLGHKNNTAEVNRQTVVVKINEELVSIRGFKPGEYIINAHLYSAENATVETPVPPFKVSLKIQKMNPLVKTVWQGDATISSIRQEVHIVRFTLDSDGRAHGFGNDLPTEIRQDPSETGGNGLHLNNGNFIGVP